ncbi:ABC transporter ATP-binding protein [Alcanivorax sp. 24]|uniref:ABC transporter ATP-binding protein n=1 Tax=Alcanivorax sp. 24 TaxID=2545266 RepID=UPI00105EE12E|nr:ABC transporter ATP-binding protein [Alcanivorax sp. 24]
MSRKTNEPLYQLRYPVAGLIRLGVLLGGVGALTSLLPFVAIVELGRVLLSPGPLDIERVAITALVIALALVLGWLCTGLALWATHVADHRMQAALRRDLVRVLGRVPLGWYSDKTSGAIRKAVQNDLEDLHHLVAHHDVERIAALVLPASGLLYLCWLDWRLMVLAVVTFPVYAVAYVWMMRGFGDKMVQLDASFSRVSAAIVEFVHGITVVKAFGQTGRAYQGYREAVHDFSERYAGWVRPLLRLEALSSLALSAPVILLATLAGGAWFLSRGWVGPLDVMAAALVGMALPQTLLTFNQGMVAQRNAQAAAKRIASLLSTELLPESRHPRQPAGSAVEFEQVSFRYGDGHEVLSDISLHCRPGTVTALVGRSGAGKSTLATLVPRFHDVGAGTVRIGGVDVREIAPEVLYRKVGFVLQNAQLVRGTVRDNLCLGRPDAEDSAIIEAARAARIHDRIVALPRGYDSVIGEDAVFSGGETQRLSIARMLLADTPILILDEATAHADPESEARIQDALSVLAKGRTVLVIAHRLASVMTADHIAVLDGGRITELGGHEALLRRDGLYAHLWRLQTGPAEEASEWEREARA